MVNPAAGVGVGLSDKGSSGLGLGEELCQQQFLQLGSREEEEDN